MAEPKLQLEDWLDDLCVRFIINLPKEDLSSVARICFQVEEAQWFYEDFIRPLDPTLPSMSLRSFCLRIFQHCPLLASFSVERHMRAFEEFLEYKTRVPVRGAILLNEAMDATVLVKGWKKGANWSFPRGKINKDEDDLDCAIREVYEETGFDIRAAGLVPKDEDVKSIQISMREQQIRLYVFRDVPMDTVFQPKTRKEISKIQWYKLSELPAFRKKGNQQRDDAAAASNANKFYMVAPFLVPLKKWVVQQKKDAAARAANNHSHVPAQSLQEEVLTEDDITNPTEMPQESSSASAPAVERLEGANQELQRLVNAQPPTQGLQLQRAGGQDHNKGEALMALLLPHQGGSSEEKLVPRVPQFQDPHTPSATISDAVQPPTPQHHHPPQHLYAIKQQPPPNFPFSPHLNANQAQNPPAAFFNQPRVPNQMMPPNPFIPAPASHQQRKEPVLLHPQPLPPQVQRSLLMRGMVPTPNLPDVMGQAIKQAGQVHPNGMPGPRHGPIQPPPQPLPAQFKRTAQLSGHAASLLNSFKSEPSRSGERPVPVSGPQTVASHSNPIPQGPYPAGTWQNSAQSGFYTPPLYSPRHLSQVSQPSPNGAAHALSSDMSSMAQFKQIQPTDTHRASLLDMFKGKPDPLSSGTSSDATVKARRSSEHSSTKVDENKTDEEPQDIAAKPTSSEAASALTILANGGQIRTHPKLNLPYRAIGLLTRPKAGSTAGQDPMILQTPQQAVKPAHAQHPTTQPPRMVKPAHGPRSRYEKDQRMVYPPQQPHPPAPSLNGQATLIRPDEAAQRPPQILQRESPAAMPYNYGQSQPLSGTQAAPSLPAAGMLHPRNEADPEQKQKLLLLFGKGQQSSPPVVPFLGDGNGKGKEPVMHDQARPDSGNMRARIAPPASVTASREMGMGTGPNSPGSRSGSGNAAMSPRGRSQHTPISPADKSFLFDILRSAH